MSGTTWDLPSVGLSWALAATSFGLTAAASKMCFSTPDAARLCLAAAAVVTAQLLGFTLTSASYRRWVATSVSTPLLGPGQVHPRTRRGLPALRSPGKGAGLDKWSLLVIALVILPCPVLLLPYYWGPKTRLKMQSKWEIPLGIDITDSASNGALYYTTGAYESVTMSIRAVVPTSAALPFGMTNTADVAIDADNNRVIIPTRVPQACNHEVVHARNQKAMVGQYRCARTYATNILRCDDVSQATAKKDDVCLYFNTTMAGGVPVQQLVAVHPKMNVTCNVTYSLATANVTWRGADKGGQRLCRLDMPADVTTNPELKKLLDDVDLTGNMTALNLPLTNAFVHTVDHERIYKLCRPNPEVCEHFYGSIFAAATAIRSIGAFDPTKPTADQGDAGKVWIQYSTQTCHQYSTWSWLVIMLLAATSLLVACSTVLGSGTTAEWLADLCHDVFGSLSCCRCCAAKSREPMPRRDFSASTARTASRTANGQQQRVPAGMQAGNELAPNDPWHVLDSSNHQSSENTVHAP